MTTKGTKRASPGAEEEKEHPLANVEISDEVATKLGNVQKDIQRVELLLGWSNYVPTPCLGLTVLDRAPCANKACPSLRKAPCSRERDF